MSGHPHIRELMDRLPELAFLEAPISQVVEVLCRCYRAGGKLLVCGNGGSAADSEHIVGELMKSFVMPRPLPPDHIKRLAAIDIGLADRLQRGIPAISLCSHTALLTAIVNDTDSSTVFAQQVYVLGKPGDVILALSTSGSSENVVNAVKVARAFGLTSVAFTGSRPSRLADLADITIAAPADETYRVQEHHLLIYHCICLEVEKELFA